MAKYTILKKKSWRLVYGLKSQQIENFRYEIKFRNNNIINVFKNIFLP